MDPEQFRLHAFMEDRHWWFLGRRRILRTLAAPLLPASADRHVVDLGCGTGGNAAAFAADCTVVGVDPDPGAIALARARFPSVTFRVGDVGAAGEAIEGADLVLLTDVLEHVDDDVGLLRAAARRAVPGARLLLTVPAHPELWSGHDVALGHRRRYTAASFRRLWEEVPVEAVLVSPFNARLYPVARALRLLRRRGTDVERRTDLRLPPAPVNRLLARIFGGEAGRLARALRGAAPPYRDGLSLLAVLRRSEP